MNFSDYCLQNNAQKIIGIDVAYGICDIKIRSNSKVCLIEKFNAKNITNTEINNHKYITNKNLIHKNILNDISFVTIDVSFISIFKILPNLIPKLSPPCLILILLKPQFECKKDDIQKGGIIKDQNLLNKLVDDSKNSLLAHKLKILETIKCNIKGLKEIKNILFYVKNKYFSKCL